MASTELTKGQKLQNGKYEIVKTLGSGSFGITYLATTRITIDGPHGKTDFKVNVTIKEFFMSELNSRSSDGTSVEKTESTLVKNYRTKFRREAENLSKLRHPNIVKVLEVFDENNTTYYVMEFIDGGSLDDYIKVKGHLPEEEALQFACEIGDALSYMHDRKMLHLDLKPKNVMRNMDGNLLLIDFGLSKQYDQNGEPESSTTLGLGRPGYAPIEQANYKQDGTFPATLDIYALGATTYKMLTGSTPPHALDILNEGFPEELFAKQGISAEATVMVEKAMSPLRKQRFQTVSELLEYIQKKTRHDSKASTNGNKVYSWSREDIENYGISMFSVMPNNKMSIYYRGHIYSCDEISINGIKSHSQVEAALDNIKYYLQKSDTDTIDFDSYLRNHKEEIDRSFNIITYCSESDLLKILYKLRQNPSAFGRPYRVVQEMQLLPLHDGFKDEKIAYEYQHLYCEAEIYDGVVDIFQAGFTESKEDYTPDTSVKKLSDFESFASLILSSVVQYHISVQDWGKDTLLLSMMPFEIKAFVWTNGQYRDSFTLVKRNTTIPAKNTETIGGDNCAIVITFLGKRFSIDVKELFRYHPKSLELTVDIDARTNIEFVFRDKEMKKEISISLTELLNYEVKINNEDTIW